MVHSETQIKESGLNWLFFDGQGGLPVIGFYEMKQDVYDTARRLKEQDVIRKQRLDFWSKYIPVLQMIEEDPSLKKACANYYSCNDGKQESLIRYLDRYFIKEAYSKDMVVDNYSELVEAGGMRDKVAAPTEEDVKSLSPEQILGCIAWHFRRDHFDNGTLLSKSVGEGYMLRMLRAYVAKEPY
jgi:hypothetical protein